MEFKKELSDFNHFIIINKIDLVSDEKSDEIEKKLHEKTEQNKIHKISALKGWGVEELKNKIASEVFFSKKGLDQEVLITNLRHKEALSRAVQALSLAKESYLKNHRGIFRKKGVLRIETYTKKMDAIIGKVVDIKAIWKELQKHIRKDQ